MKGDYPEGYKRLVMVERLVALILLAQSSRHALSIARLAREHGVCERTIYRDLQVIERHLPVRWVGFSGKRKKAA